MIDTIYKKQFYNTNINKQEKNEVKSNETKKHSEVVYNLKEHSDAWEKYCYYDVNKEKNYLEDKESNIVKLPEENSYIYIYSKGYDVENLTAKEIQDIEDHRLNEIYDVNQSIKEKIDKLKTHQDSMYRETLQEQTITINSLYQASFSGDGYKNTVAFSEGDVKSVLGMNGIAVTNENISAATKLIEWGMDVNVHDINKLQNIYAAIESLDVYEKEKQIQEELKEDKELDEKALISKDKVMYHDMTIKEVIDDLRKVDDDTIDSVIQTKDNVTIKNLREVMLRNTEKVLENKNQKTDNIVEKEAMVAGLESGTKTKGEKEQNKEQIKEQIKEIRAMLTTESAMRLSEKMPLESSTLSEVASGLRQIQDETITDAMIKEDIQDTSQNRMMIKQVMEATNAIRQSKDVVVGELDVDDLLETVHQAINAYEQSGTVPEERFGETAKRLEKEVEVFLTRENMPKDALTKEAIKALITNDMPLAIENIESAKILLEQMQIVIDELTPNVAAQWIKEGIDPYKVSVAQIVNNIEHNQLKNKSQTIASAIVTLEEKGKITESEKQSLIGVYRILESVKNNKEEILGYIYKNNLPLTIKHLDDAVRYTNKNQGFEKIIDDNTGELESLKYTKDTARMLIEKGQQSKDGMLELAKKIETFELQIKDVPEKLENLNYSLYSVIKQAFKEELGKYEGMDLLPERVREKLEDIKTVDKEVVANMEKYNIPITLNNLYWMKKINEQPDIFANMLKGQNKEMAFPETFREINETLKKLEEEAYEKKEESMISGDFNSYKQNKAIEEIVNVQKKLMDKEDFYQIPMTINGEIKTVNIYIKERNKTNKMNKSGIDAVISYDTNKLGNIKAYLHLEDEKLSYQIVANNRNATYKLEKDKEALTKILNQLGYAIMKENYKTDEISVSPMAMVLKEDSEFEIIA
ncbi:MAG: DUF6240 domain-containing protein [Cellulosilyticaceae bacterium]